MKIVQLDIQGFRSLKNVSWRPGDLNVVIGPNGSGKSNLLRMLEMISAAAQGRLSRYVQAEGGFVQLLWDGQSKGITSHLRTSAEQKTFSQSGLAEIRLPPLLYEIMLINPGADGSYRVQHELLRHSDKYVTYFSRTGFTVQIFDGEESGNLRADTISAEEAVLPIVDNPFSPNTETRDFRLKLENWSIYQDVRVDQSALIRQAPVSRLEQRVAPDGQNLVNVLHTLYTSDRQFKQDINDAMFAAFGEDFDELIFPPAADQRVQMRVRWKTLKREQSTADLSDGTLRFLFLMTVLASPNPPPLIAIDEPETGLHPSMLPIIAEFAAEAATRTQVIFTTHSDSFLDAFRDTRPTTTVAKWENGETILKTIEGEALDYWLQEYSLGSLFRSGELEEME